MDDRKCRITGRVEEWMKSICQNHKCKYYIHQDYPSCSYCTHPTNCILYDNHTNVKKQDRAQ